MSKFCLSPKTVLLCHCTVADFSQIQDGPEQKCQGLELSNKRESEIVFVICHCRIFVLTAFVTAAIPQCSLLSLAIKKKESLRVTSRFY